jgi:hypothetical protein
MELHISGLEIQVFHSTHTRHQLKESQRAQLHAQLVKSSVEMLTMLAKPTVFKQDHHAQSHQS